MREEDCLRVVLDTIDPNYTTKASNNDWGWLDNSGSFEQVSSYAQKNGLYYALTRELVNTGLSTPNLDEELWSATKSRVEDCKNTIKFLEKLCNKNELDYVLIKLFNSVEHVPNDIDIFISRNDRKKLIHVLEENGMETMYSSITETKLKGDYVKTDIYTQVRHVGMDFMDDDLVWTNKTQNMFMGVEYPTLNSNADLLMLIPHHVLVHKRMTLLDFLHLKNRIKGADIAWCRDYAYEKGWGRFFDLTLKRVNSLKYKIYKENGYAEFPYVFDTRFVLRCISESSGPNVRYYNKPFLYMSFYLQDLIYRIEGTYLYRLLRSVPLVRRLLNNISSLLKVLRGDRTNSN